MEQLLSGEGRRLMVAKHHKNDTTDHDHCCSNNYSPVCLHTTCAPTCHTNGGTKDEHRPCPAYTHTLSCRTNHAKITLDTNCIEPSAASSDCAAKPARTRSWLSSDTIFKVPGSVICRLIAGSIPKETKFRTFPMAKRPTPHCHSRYFLQMRCQFAVGLDNSGTCMQWSHT